MYLEIKKRVEARFLRLKIRQNGEKKTQQGKNKQKIRKAEKKYKNYGHARSIRAGKFFVWPHYC